MSLGLITLGLSALGQDVEGTDPHVGAVAEYFPEGLYTSPDIPLAFVVQQAPCRVQKPQELRHVS